MSDHYADSLRIYNKYKDEAEEAEETDRLIAEFLAAVLKLYQEQRKGMH